MRGIAAGGDGTVQCFACFGVILLLKVEFGQLLEISGGGIVENLCFERVDARALAESLEDAAEQPEVRDHLDDYIDRSSQDATKNNDEEPIRFGTAPDEM